MLPLLFLDAFGGGQWRHRHAVPLLQEKLERQGVPVAVQRVEAQVAAMLARMEVAGVEFDPQLLLHHGSTIRSRMGECEQVAARMAGE